MLIKRITTTGDNPQTFVVGQPSPGGRGVVAEITAVEAGITGYQVRLPNFHRLVFDVRTTVASYK